MSTSLYQSPFVAGFVCLGDKCEDTCCKGWSMQVDAPTIAKYAAEAPELLAAVDQTDPNLPIMRRDPTTDYCVKFESGLCGIHKARGSDFLGDACHFYPRTTRSLGDISVMTATPSCPEVVRLAVLQDNAPSLEQAAITRLPTMLKNYAPDGITAADALAVHQTFLNASEDASASAERVLLRLASVANSLAMQPVDKWKDAAAFYLKMADGRIPAAETKLEDPYHLLHALGGLVVAARKQNNTRLRETMQTIETALECPFDWDNILITPAEDSVVRYAAIKEQWDTKHAAAFAPKLKRWVRLQLGNALFPFAGFGHSLYERVMVIAVRFATLRLALMSALYNKESLGADEEVRIIQSLARLLDHLADPAFSLQIYQEAGWDRESRLGGLLQ